MVGVPDQAGTDHAELLLDRSIFPETAVVRACYALADKAVFSVSRPDDASLKVTFKPIAPATRAEVVTALRAAVVDFSVRVDIEGRTASIRDAIWRTAFAECLAPRDRS